jgi:hypothetical protein
LLLLLPGGGAAMSGISGLAAGAKRGVRDFYELCNDSRW